MTAYLGPERRIHRVFVTRNTEYHVRESTCVAVRALREGEKLRENHPAVGTKMMGGLRPLNNGAILPNLGVPAVGDRVCFGDILTSRVQRVERPERDVVACYPSGGSTETLGDASVPSWLGFWIGSPARWVTLVRGHPCKR